MMACDRPECEKRTEILEAMVDELLHRVNLGFAPNIAVDENGMQIPLPRMEAARWFPTTRKEILDAATARLSHVARMKVLLAEAAQSQRHAYDCRFLRSREGSCNCWNASAMKILSERI